VAVIGDSYTLPAGVDIEEAYHSLIEERLNLEQRGSVHGITKFEFINFAGSGGYLINYLGVMKHRIVQYDPDLVLIGFCSANDFRVPPKYVTSRDFKPKGPYYPFFHESFAKRIGLSYGRIYFKQLLTHAGFLTGAQKAYSDEQMSYMADVFSQIQDFSKRMGIPIGVAYLSHRGMIDRRVESVLNISINDG